MAWGICRNSRGGKQPNCYLVNWKGSTSGFASIVKVGVTTGQVAGCGGDNKFGVTIQSWSGNIATISMSWGEGNSTAMSYTTVTLTFDYSQSLGTTMTTFHTVTCTVLDYMYRK